MLGDCDGAGQELLPFLEEEEELSLKPHRLRKSHRLSSHSDCRDGERERERSRSERGSFHLSKSQELPWQVETTRQLWDHKEAEEESSHKRKKRRRQKSWKYQTGEYLIERDKEEHTSCCHKRRKSKAGNGRDRLVRIAPSVMRFWSCSTSVVRTLGLEHSLIRIPI